jgi:hypothetical protein
MKLRATYETQTYITRDGYFAIHQVDQLGEESVVCLSPDQMRLLVLNMQKELEDTSWWADAIEEE